MNLSKCTRVNQNFVLFCHMSNIIRHTLYLGVLLLVASCQPNMYKHLSTYKHVPTGAPDYNNVDFWAAHPNKQDPSDSVPKPLRGGRIDQPVDVFFLHPTTFTDPQKTNDLNARMDDDSLNLKTDQSPILYQASIFNKYANVWAPRYRQAHINMYWYKDTATALRAFDTAYSDIARAFEYFLAKNPGRPFIIASHSQGTTHAKRLIKEYVDNSNLKNRLVAAYLVGIAVAPDEFKNIPVCKDSNQTGCFVSWRTYRRGVESTGNTTDANAVVVNPLTWTTDSTMASKQLHRGAILYKFNSIIRKPNDAQIHNNMLWISRPKFPGGFLYKTKNYHVGDYNLFYLNVQENVKRRIDLFWK